MSKEQLSVLIIEDDEDDFFIARSLLARAKSIRCEVDWAHSYEEGIEAVTSGQYDVCLVDYRLGARDGLDLLREADHQGNETPMILLTGQGDLEVDLKAMMAGAADYLVKGQIDAQLLERSIRYARERKRAEERIREQAALLEKARDAISAYDLDRRVVYWNRSAERLTGWAAEEVIGMVADEHLYEEGYAQVREAWETVQAREEWTGELRQRTKSGQDLMVESRWTLVRDAVGTARSVLVISTDITERKRLETQFLRAQRMESIGTLVGGIAHDLGNLLVPVLLGVKVLQQRHADDEKTTRTLDMIRRSAQRGADMVKQVLAFARGVEGERVQMQPVIVIQEVEKITQETFPATIRVDVEVPDDLWVIKGDATQLQQVLMNLAVNARDAMTDGGALRIQAQNLYIDENYLRVNFEAQPGPYVCLSVADTGEGIPSDVLDKVFEPFFTTKPTGKGTGLGLSTVYSIIKSHGGFVNVYSEMGEGTTFQVYLPAASDQTMLLSDATTGEMDRGNGELILLVDDEDSILEVAQDTLEEIGYRVVTARNGLEAIDRFNAHRAGLDAMVTDLMMPEMDGIEAIRKIRGLGGELPIIAASGMSGTKSREAMTAGADFFLSKPFTAEKLCAALYEVLHPEARSPGVAEG